MARHKWLALPLIWVVLLELAGLTGVGIIRLWGISTHARILPPPYLRPNFPAGTQDRLNNYHPNLSWFYSNTFFGKEKVYGEKQGNEFRIFVLGGSTVEGHGRHPPLLESQTIPFHLERLLRSSSRVAERGLNIRVLNEGSSGYYSKQELLLLTTRILPYLEPDYIIVLNGFNDFHNSVLRKVSPPPRDKLTTAHWHFREAQVAQSVESMGNGPGSLLIGARWGLAHVLARTYIGQLLDIIAAKTRGKETLLSQLIATLPDIDDLTPPTPGSVEYWFTNAAMARASTEAVGSRFLWVLQPLFTGKPNRTEQETRTHARVDARYWKWMEDFSREAETRLADSSLRAQAVNLLGLFQSDPRLIYDDTCHYTPDAQLAIATALAPRVENDILAATGAKLVGK